jgi:nitroreductase
MQFLDLVNRRYSVRRYDPDRTVDREIIDRCLEAARMAPSACNAQPWRFVVVDDPDTRRKVAAETHSRLVTFNKFADKAPVLIVVMIEEGKAVPQIGGFLKGTRYSLVDIGIAAEHFCLQATDEGLGTCMMGWFNETPIRKLLGAPRGSRIALVITAGYPLRDDTPRKRPRKDLDAIRSFNHY